MLPQFQQVQVQTKADGPWVWAPYVGSTVKFAGGSWATRSPSHGAGGQVTWLVMACPSFTSPLWKCLTHPGPWALPQALMGIGGTSPAPTLLPTLRKAPGKPSRSARKHKSRREVRTAGGRADEAGVAGAPHGGLQLGLTWGRGLLGGDRAGKRRVLDKSGRAEHMEQGGSGSEVQGRGAEDLGG